MWNVRITEKQIRECFDKVIFVGADNLHCLLGHLEKSGYTSRVYGWNADVYNVRYGVCILSGYRYNMKVIRPDYGLIEKYENKAIELRNTYKFDDIAHRKDELIQEFVNEVLKLARS